MESVSDLDGVGMSVSVGVADSLCVNVALGETDGDDVIDSEDDSDILLV